MDRFVTRAPTWKKMNYGQVAAQSVNNRPTNSKLATSQIPNKQKMPLQQKQLEVFTKSQDFGDRLTEIFRPNSSTAPAPAAENFNSNSNDSGLSSASSISPPQHMEDICPSPVRNMQTPKKKMLGKLGDYVDCPEEKENDTCMTITHTPKSSQKATESKVKALGLKEYTPSKQLLPQTPKVNKLIATGPSAVKTADKIAPSNPMLMSRIQRDLNSPSASVRVRALKAIASPTKSPYTHFDIPEAEQSLNFSAAQEAPDIKDVMRDIIVYVEVRSGEDNRSDGVRKVIEALGARVNLKLFRDTTHVVFKDGLMSTFKKAQQWGIPVVSILWIEACKTKNRICDPKDFPISNLDRYENPELYTRMKRFKYMQPDSETSINRKVTGSAQKDMTPTKKTGAIKKNSTLIGSTPTSSSNIKKKTDISQYFKKLDNSDRTMTTPITRVATSTGGASGSQASLILNRINSNTYTPVVQSKITAHDDNNITKTKNIECYDEASRESTVAADASKTQKVKKALDFFQPNGTILDSPSSRTRRRSSIAAGTTPQINDATLEDSTIQISTTPTKPSRRHSVLPANEMVPTTMNMSIAPSKPPRRRSVLSADEIETNTMGISMTPSKNSRRRSSIHTPKNMTMETPRKDKKIQPIIEEDAIPEETENNSEEIITKSVAARKTLHSTKAMEISERSVEAHNGDTARNAIKENQPSARRRTLYCCTSMSNSSISNTTLDSSNVTTRRQPTCYSVKSIETDNTQNAWDRTKEVANKIIAQKSADLIKKIINPMIRNDESGGAAAPKSASTNRRRTLYTPRKSNPNMNTSVAAIEPQVSDGICITPTASNMVGKVACSTLLESADKNAKPIETPPPTATTGKILEETAKCVTPFVFSSTRQPGNRRRTLFDVSMDIITQRLQCINQSARRSLVPTTDDLDNPPIVDTRKTILPNSDTENSTTPQSSKSDNNRANDEATTESSLTPSLNKKRKLFKPNEILTPPTTTKLNTSLCNSSMVKTTTATSSEQKSVAKRRRTLVPLSQPLLSTTLTSSDLIAQPSSPLLKRRSTFDFEQIKKVQNKIAQNGKSKKDQVEDLAADMAAAVKESDQSAGDVVKTKKTPVLVYTNMHTEQIDVIREVVDKLCLFNLEQTVTDSTTHLVSLEPRRTMNLLRALLRGLWIVDYNWILDSLKAGDWLAEEPYELRGFSRAIEHQKELDGNEEEVDYDTTYKVLNTNLDTFEKSVHMLLEVFALKSICRSERQAFGDHYKCELFRDLGAFYISVRCYPVTKSDLCELITSCGGRLALSRNKARYIIGDNNPSLSDKIYVTPYWILDSISQMQILKVQKYTCPKPDERPIFTSPVAVSPR